MPLDITNWVSPSTTIADVLAASDEITLIKGAGLTMGYMPDNPTNCVTIIDGSGGDQDSVNNVDEVSIQVLVRNEKYNTGYSVSRLIQSILQSIEPQTVGNVDIIGIWVKSNVAYIGRDAKDKPMFSTNFRVMLATEKDLNRKFNVT